MNEQKLQQYLFWMVGGLDYRRWEHVYLAVGPVLCGIIIMCLLARHLNILVLGETEAKAVGMPVTAFRMGLLFVAAMTTATSVCVSGNIGFVGLVIPHMMRMLIGPDHRVLLPASALGGAAFFGILRFAGTHYYAAGRGACRHYDGVFRYAVLPVSAAQNAEAVLLR